MVRGSREPREPRFAPPWRYVPAGTSDQRLTALRTPQRYVRGDIRPAARGYTFVTGWGH